MKTLFLMLALACAAYAQEVVPERPLSNIEQFSATTGLLDKRFISIGSVRSVRVQALIFTDLTTRTRVGGVRFSLPSLTGSAEKYAFIDADEIDNLAHSINVMKTSVFNTIPEDYTEVVYTSRSGFQAGAHNSRQEWVAFLKLDRDDPASNENMRPDDFEQLLILLQQVKEKLK